MTLTVYRRPSPYRQHHPPADPPAADVDAANAADAALSCDHCQKAAFD